MKIYVASSWRNRIQPDIVEQLREAGHEVYDFHHPEPGNDGFSWSEIDPNWRSWTTEQFRKALNHPIAVDGFTLDMNALRWCDACVLVLPCGRSAHLELGYAVGAGKKTIALALPEFGPHEPELMYRMLNAVCLSVDEVKEALRLFDTRKALELSVVRTIGKMLVAGTRAWLEGKEREAGLRGSSATDRDGSKSADRGKADNRRP